MIQTEGRFYDEVQVGDVAVFSRSFTEADVSLAVGLTGDFSPYHIDAEFCAGTPFKKPILPGLLSVSLGSHIGGQWAFLLRELHMNFLAPAYVGDTLTCKMTVTEKSERNKIRGEFELTNQNGKKIGDGYVTGYPPDRKTLEKLARKPETRIV